MLLGEGYVIAFGLGRHRSWAGSALTECAEAKILHNPSQRQMRNRFQDRIPVLGTKYLELVWSVPKTGLQY